MAEFQWWLLIAGLAVGGTVVALLTASFARRDADEAADELEAEATFLAGHLGVDRASVVSVLEAHREYLGLPAPNAIVAPGSAGDGDADEEPNDVGDGGRGRPDRDLSGA